MLEFFGFIWDLIQSILDSIINVVNFLKEIIVFIPNIFSQLPRDIAVLAITTFTTLIGIFIFRFIK